MDLFWSFIRAAFSRKADDNLGQSMQLFARLLVFGIPLAVGVLFGIMWLIWWVVETAGGK